ncbi:serine/threonine-protein kinase [Spirilliplanes yamanashiensis]|uniref:Protein kinase domain-containing protein n=1 Tax=Spirilliplanes yamanashiensis TaxID=42233 RepID=A0A8J3Y4K7_9ACTN|nr:serine/threonine-protein kinase [Spirilliplanes yamanashiensis]MDP9819796.1 serine/threonine protein kinase [Spirilliplanes yamanashiensis]GIJ01384.1 hypothetical protein Sya03_07360 [Spirilliplanes yamanashiensis]
MPENLLPRDPRRIGPYELTARLGAGGMGTVYLGRSPGGQDVAVKVVRSEFAVEDEFRARFRSEVERARQVPPFCTAEVLDADPEADPPYLVVEYVDGPSLAEVVERRGPLSAGTLHGVAIGVATALTAIHGAGVIHRDLKPRNVLLPPGNPKVIDFGIARAFEPTSQHTRTGQMLGTVAYMAPERFDDTASGRAVTPAADVFAWGAVVTYAGTGRTPFQADSAPATAMRIVSQPPVLDGLPPHLRDLVALTLAKNPADRPHARELLDLLLAGGQADLARRPALRRAATSAARHAAPDTGDRPWPGAAPTGTPTGGAATVVASRPPSPPGRPPGPPFPPPRPPRRSMSGWQIAGICLTGIVVAVGALWFLASGLLTLTIGALIAAGEEPTEPVVSSSPVASEPLRTAGAWKESISRDGGAICAFDEGLVISRKTAGEHRCDGPAIAVAGSHDVTVDVALLSPGTCGVLWFDARDGSGYRADVCATGVTVRSAQDRSPLGALEVKFPQEIEPGGSARMRFYLAPGGGNVSISRDGVVLADSPMDALHPATGTLRLGLTAPRGYDETAQVRFTDLDVRALS